MTERKIKLFLAIESFLYVVFLSLDLIGQYQASIGWKYAGILLCCFFSLSYQNKGKLVPAALTLTALADLFLLVLDQYYIFGLLLFFFVQMIYAVRLHQLNSPWFAVARIMSPVFVFIILYAAGFINPINLLAALYFTQLILNAISAWAGRKNTLFAIGLTLFVCCDICVGAYNVPSLVPAALYEACYIGMWLFYLPSQVIITLSSIEPYEKR